MQIDNVGMVTGLRNRNPGCSSVGKGSPEAAASASWLSCDVQDTNTILKESS